MKKIILFFSVLGLFFMIGCKSEKQEIMSAKDQVDSMRALVANLVQEHTVNRTEDALLEAKNINHLIMNLTKDNPSKYDTMMQIKILELLDEKAEALSLKIQISDKELNYAEWLFTRALKYKVLDDKEQSDSYFDQAFIEIEKALKINPDSEQLLNIKTQAYILAKSKKEAKKLVDDIYKSREYSRYWKIMYENFDSIYDETITEYSDPNLKAKFKELESKNALVEQESL